jgi:tetratricopeptide (TPR) repeat protein
VPALALLPFALDCFVMYVTAARLLGRINRPRCLGVNREMKYQINCGVPVIPNPRQWVRNLVLLFAFVCALFTAPLAHAGQPTLPPAAQQAMNKMYGGDPDAAIAILHNLEQSQPENPLAFLLEGEAQWWKIYCANLEIKYGMIDAWKRGKKPEDDAYFALADKVISLAQAQIAKSDSAEMHFYVGMGWALKVRLDVLRGDNRAVARAGVAARSEFLRALELDPQLADATAGLGLYNYYVDSLSAAVKILRFFMGIPGGNKTEGVQQIQVGIDRGAITPVEMRFHLAKNLRTFDQQYERAAQVAQPLVERYPTNAIFQLLLGNLNAELGRRAKAAEYFHAALKLSSPTAARNCCPSCQPCDACSTRTRDISSNFLSSVN